MINLANLWLFEIPNYYLSFKYILQFCLACLFSWAFTKSTNWKWYANLTVGIWELLAATRALCTRYQEVLGCHQENVFHFEACLETGLLHWCNCFTACLSRDHFSSQLSFCFFSAKSNGLPSHLLPCISFKVAFTFLCFIPTVYTSHLCKQLSSAASPNRELFSLLTCVFTFLHEFFILLFPFQIWAESMLSSHGTLSSTLWTTFLWAHSYKNLNLGWLVLERILAARKVPLPIPNLIILNLALVFWELSLLGCMNVIKCLLCCSLPLFISSICFLVTLQKILSTSLCLQ